MYDVNSLVQASTAYLASGVEAVEALTVVLAVGIGRSWRVALQGAGFALATLVAIVALFGPLLQRIPLAKLELAIGLFLILFGCAWLRKAMLRYAGRKAMRNEDANFAREVAVVRDLHDKNADRVALATAYNAVLLEGLEVVVIVISFGAASVAALRAASFGALAAVASVVVLGLILRRPAARVPENTMKLIVGVMLTSLGTFWTGEGLGIVWWRDSVSLLCIIVLYSVVSISVASFARSTLQGRTDQ